MFYFYFKCFMGNKTWASTKKQLSLHSFSVWFIYKFKINLSLSLDSVTYKLCFEQAD